MKLTALTPASRRLAVRRFGQRVSLGAGAFCLVVIAGWLLELPILTSFLTGRASTKISTALSVLLIVVALNAGLAERQASARTMRGRMRLFGMGAGALLLYFGGLVLYKYLSGHRLDVPEGVASVPPSFFEMLVLWPSPAVAASLILAGISLLIWRHPRRLGLFSTVNGCLALIGWLGLNCAILGVGKSSRSPFFETMSLPAALAVFMVAIGLFCLRPMEGLARLFSSPNHAGRMVRWLTTAGVLLTPGLGLLHLRAQEYFHFTTALGIAIYGTAMCVALAFISLYGAWLVERLEQQRQRAEQKTLRELAARQEALRRLDQRDRQLAVSEQRVRGIFNCAFNFIGLLAPDGTLLEANQTALDLIGAQPADVLGRAFAETPWWAHSAEERAKLCAGIERAARGEVVRFETSHPDANGDTHYVDFTLKPVLDASGQVVHLVPEGRDITERKQAAEALRTSLEEFRTLAEALPQIVWMTRPDGWNIYFNQQWVDYTGLTFEESRGHGWNKPFHPDDQQRAREAWTEATTKFTTYSLECRLRRADGVYRWWLIRGEPLRDPKGSILKWFGTCTDIHDLKLAEEQRQQAVNQIEASEELLRQFIKFTPAAIAMLDTEMRYVQTSDRWIKDYHLEGQDVIGRSHYEVFPDIPQNWKDIHQRVLGGAVESCDEDPFPRANGSVEWLQWDARPWRKAGGELGGIVFYTQVITARKEAEAQMRESEERFRGAFENAPIGMAMVSLTGRWMRVNRALCGIVGLTETELLASTFQDITHPEDLDADLEQVRALISGQSDHYTMEKRYIHKSGGIVWVLLAATIVRSGDGTPLHFVSQIEDITERHEAAERLRASLEEKEVLLREIHHRVKNNLQVISSLLQLQSGYLRDPQDVAMFRECQARIHAMGLVHDRLYRSDNLSTIDFSEHLRELIALIVRGQSTNVEGVRVVIESEPLEVNLDTAIPLGLITTELITNAYKHAFLDRAAGVITVSLSRTADRQLTLTVEDDGVGLPAGIEPQKARSLGLRLIRALAGQLRGEFVIASSETGCRVNLIFPV